MSHQKIAALSANSGRIGARNMAMILNAFQAAVKTGMLVGIGFCYLALRSKK